MENCSICGSVKNKQIPAGISKSTNKPYPAFMACPNGCKAPKTNFNNQNTGGFSGQYAKESRADEKWKEIREEKSDEIRANVALKMVSELIAAGKIDLKDWKIWANQFYAYSPIIAPKKVEVKYDYGVHRGHVEDDYKSEDIPLETIPL